MSSWLDHLPSQERTKIRQRLRSPEAYEKLREKVKGPEDLEREMARNEVMAELSFALETEPVVREALTNQVKEDVAERGVEELFGEVSPEELFAIEQGKFEVTIDKPESSPEQLVVIPEGNVNEKIPLKRNVADVYLQQFVSDQEHT